MGRKPGSPKGADEIAILPIKEGVATFFVVGTSPLIFNRLSEKARRELLMPAGRRRTQADRAANLKHDPMTEYRDSVYRNQEAKAATRLYLPAPAFKGTMMTAALDLPGTTRTEVGRLVWVEGIHVDVYGIPQLMMTPVRSADINKTPDIRTRAILGQWACIVSIRFVEPKLTAGGVSNLFATGGITAGVGDFRQEKGKGNFGQFRLTDQHDPAFRKIVAEGGKAAQDAALAEPICWDAETEELLAWFTTSVNRLDADRRPLGSAPYEPIDPDQDEYAPPRRRGRPPTKNLYENDVEAHTPPAKRGPGRPPKADPAVAASAVRGRGNGNGRGRTA